MAEESPQNDQRQQAADSKRPARDQQGNSEAGWRSGGEGKDARPSAPGRVLGGKVSEAGGTEAPRAHAGVTGCETSRRGFPLEYAGLKFGSDLGWQRGAWFPRSASAPAP